MIKKRSLLLFIVIVLAGCTPSASIENIQLVQTLGVDEAGENKVRATAATTIFTQGQQGASSKTETFTSVSHIMKDVQRILQGQSPKPIRLGKMKVVLFDEELARRGLFPFVDALGRDPRIGRLLYLLIVEEDTKKLLEGNYPSSSNVSEYLLEMMEHNMKQNVPHFNIHDFFYTYDGKGMDPFLPLIKKNKDKIEITGLALFDDDKYVDSISFRDSFVFKMLLENFQNGLYEVEAGEDGYLEIETIKSKVKYEIKNGNDHPRISIYVKMQGFIEDEIGVNLKGNRNLQEIEKKTAKDLEKKSLNMIRKFQEKGIDPLRFGSRVKYVTRNWSEEKWEGQYPSTDFRVNVDVKIIQKGILE
ncbi:Ger(x)C family spore germination protein [Bacillus songklensis]|uniref:Ger(X)C family spore germination protein n=1 Tax=Bacillus songklensis TaxID=1069116 RepID=A0ABV8B3R3_9BACI